MMMKFCKQCGQSLSEGKLFCSHCGEAVVVSEIEKKFCRECGNSLEGDECTACSQVTDTGVDTESKYCKECGGVLQGDEECQRCLASSGRYCKNCGTAISQYETYCTDCIDSANRQPVITAAPSNRKKKPRTLMISLIIFAILLAGSATYGFFYVKDASSPSHTTEAFIEALEEKDAPALQDILAETSDIPLTRAAMQNYIEQLHSNPDVLEKVIQDIKRQEKVFTASAQNGPDPFLFQLNQASEKKWLFIDQYTVELIPVSFTIKTDRDAQVFINDKEVPPTEKSLRTVENVIPGEFTFKAIKKGELGEFETSQSLHIWEDSDEPVSLVFDEQYITVTSEFEGAEVYLNGEPYGTIVDSSLRIGPISAGDSVAVSGKYTYPWEEVYSVEVTASASDTIELEFPIATSVVINDLTSDIINYNTSYIESITYVDSSVLRNVKGAQLEDNIKTVKNLQKRSITYGGHMNDMIFDKQSFSIKEENGIYTASINVEERYASSWNDPSDPDAAITIPKTYYYTYYCEYDEEAGQWFVYDSKEHEGLTIKEPI
jgi:uncharacterized membrane protein YvbJ